MQTTASVKLLPTKAQEVLIKSTMKEYIKLVNSIVADYVGVMKNLKYTSKDVSANLPSALKNQAIRDSSSVFKKYKKDVSISAKSKKARTKAKSLAEPKEVKVPILKNEVAIWNNQNFNVENSLVCFPVMINGKSKKIKVKAVIASYQDEKLKHKLGSLRITVKSGKLIAQIACETPALDTSGHQTMGVDLGLKIPAVAVCGNHKVKFFGNGRQNKYIKRMNRARRKKLSKFKQLEAIRNLDNKEQRFMKDKDHKISRKIVNFAIENNVSTIRLESLSGIRQTARISRKNEKNLHTWSFYRLAAFIEYKAILAGIKVEFVNPRNTSKKCPACETLNTAKDRKYTCSCGYSGHRDIVGAQNIISAPVIIGKRLSA